jgi:hypothetical protein
MKCIVLCHRVLWAFLCTCMLVSWGGAQITQHVTGLGNPALDPVNVQNAVDAVGVGGTVILHGTFDFGVAVWPPAPDPIVEAGSVHITSADVTLLGVDNAKILGGGHVSYLPPTTLLFVSAIEVFAPGVRVTGIELDGSIDTGLLVNGSAGLATDKPIIIENNKLHAAWSSLFVTGNIPVRILNNEVIVDPYYGWGIAAFFVSSSLTIDHNIINAPRVVGPNLFPQYGMYVTENPGSVSITRNTIRSDGMGEGIHFCVGPGGAVISDNDIQGAARGISVHNNGVGGYVGPVTVTRNTIVPPSVVDFLSQRTTDIYVWANQCPLIITENVITAVCDRPGDVPSPIHQGIWLWAWQANVAGPDLDNPPILVKKNTISIRYPFAGPKQNYGIALGSAAYGIGNVTVESNTISGAMMEGMEASPYGRNNVFADNDLSGLRSWYAQLRVLGGGTTVKDNVFGYANGIPGTSTAVELASWRGAMNQPKPLPTEYCTLVGNNYRLTGLPGWSGANTGCIKIFSYADMGKLGAEVANNLIKETGRFPKGTGGPAQQVFEYKTSSGLVHDNRIVGLPADFLADPGIGQRLKAVREIGGDYDLAGLGNVHGKKGMKCAEDPGGLEQAAAEPVAPISEQAAEASTLPSRLELIGNYPNPFNPSTTIRYGLPLRSHVSLAVYNALGQQVSVLQSGEQEAGYHDVKFDASALPSGVYFYRLQAGSYVETRRLLLLR